MGEVLPDPLPGCTIRVGFAGGSVVGVLRFFLGAFLKVFSLVSVPLSAASSLPFASLAAMTPQASCSISCPANAEKDSENRGGSEDG